MTLASFNLVMRKTGSVLCLSAAIFAAISSSAAHSHACSFDAPPVGLVGYPSHGAAVPTDVVPIYDALAANVLTPEMLASASFVLRSASGTVVPTTAATSTYPWHFELMPAGLLAANTTYVLEATLPSRYPPDPVKHTITFWTGEGPAAPPAPPNDVLIQNYAYDGPLLDSCDPPRHGTCVAVPEGHSIVWQHEPPRHAPALLRAPAMNNFMNASSGPPSGCLSLRTRGHNGALSEPVLKCAETTPLFQLSSIQSLKCTSAGLMETKPVSPTPAPGCSMTAGSIPNSRGWLASVLALIGLLRVTHARRTAARQKRE